MFAKSEKDAIVAEARAMVARDFGHVPEGHNCVQSTFCVLYALHKRGVRAIPQAGSFSWQAVADIVDDGTPTHYSMIWSPDELPSQIAVLLGSLPEIHSWAAIPETQEIIDLNVKHFPLAWKTVTGYDWTTPLPPDYLWTTSEACPHEAYYEAVEEATLLAAQTMEKMVKRLRAKRRN